MKAGGYRTLAIGTGLLLSILVAGPVCNESLPPYTDPRDIFDGSVQGAYVLTFSDNSVKIYFDARNRFDETLEGPATLQGMVEIVHATNTSIRKQFTITSANLFTTKNYNSSTGVLRVDPGETLRFGLSWDLVDDNGQNLRTSLFRYWTDTDCSFRCVAEEERFIISGYVDIYPKTGRVVADPSSFSLCHVNVYVGPRSCPPVLYEIPCSKRAVTMGPDAKRCP